MFKFEQLNIWKDSISFTRKVYSLTLTFPQREQFGLSDQLRRASTSVAANIAEGSGSSSKKDFAHYLDISIKSLYEVVSHLYVAYDQRYISDVVRKEFYDDAETLVRKIKSFKLWLSKNN